MRLEIVVFAPLLDVEAGTGAVGVLIVSVDGGDGVFFHQVLDKLEENKTLRLSASVGGVAVGIKSTDIGDADALGVVARAVGTDLLDGTARADAAVGIDDIVIADVVPSEAFMVATDALYGAVGIRTGGSAVEDDFGDGSHGANGFKWFNGHLGAATVFAPQGRGAHQQHTGQRRASRLPAVRSACLVRARRR